MSGTNYIPAKDAEFQTWAQLQRNSVIEEQRRRGFDKPLGDLPISICLSIYEGGVNAGANRRERSLL
jgi:hypothetical protein